MTTREQVVARLEALSERSWKKVEELLPHIERIAQHGPDGSGLGQAVVRRVFKHVVGEIYLRKYLLADMEGR